MHMTFIHTHFYHCHFRIWPFIVGFILRTIFGLGRVLLHHPPETNRNLPTKTTKHMPRPNESPFK